MGDSAVGPPVNLAKRSKKDGKQNSGAPKHPANRSPSSSRTSKKKKKVDSTEATPIDQLQQEKLLQSNKYHALEDGASGTPPAQKEIQRKEKCPPIYVPGKDPAFLRPLLFERDEPATCTFRLCSGGVKLNFESKACYHRALKYLIEPEWVEHYTHDDPATRPLKVVLRGLEDQDPQKLKEDLEENGLQPLEVHKITRRDTTRKYRDQPFLIHLERGSATLKELQKVKTYDDCQISWERYRPVHRDVTQCMRCQRFGHGIKNCRMARRCVDCGGYHQTERCNAEQPKCANCNGEHQAKSKDCPKRTEFIAVRKRASTKHQPNRGPAPPALNTMNFPPLQPQRPLASGTTAPGPQAQQSTSTQWPTIAPGLRQQAANETTPVDDGSTLFTATQLVPMFQQLMARLQTCKSKIEQIYALGLFVIENVC